MRVISKQISLEDFTSRLPGVVPAYIPGTTTPILFDEESLKAREYAYPSNYGLVPMFVNTDKGCLSWETISDWYHFFTDYYHLLNDWGHCGIKYNSAIEYYNNESKNGYASQMIYGSDEQTYIDLDTTFNERGGRAMYEFICKELIPSIDIPSEYTDYWHCTKLFYPDYIKWRGWFINRYPKYSGYTNNIECSAATDCCDCAEYFNRGGNNMYSGLTAATFDIPETTDNFCEPKFLTDISLQVSIDDMGEFSIFSEEYELGIDYRTGRYGASANTHGGTVVAIDGKAMILRDGSPGFDFDPEYMEKYFNPDQWEGYSGITAEEEDTRYYQSATTTGYYGFKSDFSKVTCATTEDVRSALTEYYSVTPLDAAYIEGSLYDISKEEWGDYKGDSARTFYVFREDYTETPYTLINGKKIYADVRPQNKEKYFYFPFFYSDNYSASAMCDTRLFNPDNYKWFPRSRGESELAEFIVYDGSNYEISGDTIIINGNVFKRVIGSFANDDGEFYISKSGETEPIYNVYTVNDFNELILDSGYTYNPTSGNASTTINNDADVYQYGYLKGRTASKLNDLRTNSTLVDDTGDPIEGRYDVSGKTNHQPPQGKELDLIYEVGNIGRMYPIDSLSGGSVNYYFGDMITNMKFYYIGYDGTKYPAEGKKWDKSSLKTIRSIDSEISTPSISGNVDSGTVYCDIDYIIGGTFKGTVQKDTSGLTTGTKYELAGGDFSSGVTYHETVRFVRTQVQYKLARGKEGQIPTTFNTPTAHSLCYPVICYILEQDKEVIESDYDNVYEYPVADFEMIVPPNSGWSGYSTSTEIFPVFRQEYLFGSSTMQNLDVDIYIDRGTNAAFEKHLKLGEVTSMEALEQYTNGYFKMMEN